MVQKCFRCIPLRESVPVLRRGVVLAGVVIKWAETLCISRICHGHLYELFVILIWFPSKFTHSIILALNNSPT